MSNLTKEAVLKRTEKMKESRTVARANYTAQVHDRGASVISSGEVKKANAQSSYLANVAMTKGMDVWAGELKYVPAEKGANVVSLADKELQTKEIAKKAISTVSRN